MNLIIKSTAPTQASGKRNQCWKSLKATILTIGIAVVIGGCATVPMTDRRQVTLIPSSQMLSLSSQQYRQVLTESTLASVPNQKMMVTDVGLRISNAVDEFYRENGMENDFEWEFNLIEDDNTVNAWCMPGGKIAFYTGILKFTQNEAGIAAVMGHEVAHAIANHGNERMSQSMIANFGTAALSKAMESQPGKTQQLFSSALGLGTKYGVILPFSRLQESEADRIGLILMAKAGYDPKEAIQFWKRMSSSKSSAPPEILSTHPSDKRRISDLNKLIPEALTHYKAAN